MAINLITQPDATVPIQGTAFTQQNLLINAALAQGDEVLTDWAESTTAPAIKQGTYFYHSGNSYQTQDNDASITGSPVSGANYIGLTESGGVLTAEYITDISTYVWNPAYNGLYSGSTLIIRAVTYLIGSAYLRALGADKAQSGMFILSDGSFVSSAGQFNLGDKDIVTSSNVICSDLVTTGGDPVFDSVTSGSSALKWKRFSGTTNSSGVASFSHGLTVANIYSVVAIVQKSGGDYEGIVQNGIDYGTTITMATSRPSETYRATVFYI